MTEAIPTKYTRPRGAAIRVWVTPDEQQQIARRAQEAGMSQSAYLRAVGVGTPIQSTVDGDAVMTLLRANGDLGRVGGLLKWWLSERPGFGAKAESVREVLAGIEAAMAEMIKAAGSIQVAKRRSRS